MADTERAENPMDDQPGKLPEPKEAGTEMGKEPTGDEPKPAMADEEE